MTECHIGRLLLKHNREALLLNEPIWEETVLQMKYIATSIISEPLEVGNGGPKISEFIFPILTYLYNWGELS